MDLSRSVLLLPEPGHRLEVRELSEEDAELGEMTGRQELAGVPGEDDVNEELLRSAGPAGVVRAPGGHPLGLHPTLLTGGPAGVQWRDDQDTNYYLERAA